MLGQGARSGGWLAEGWGRVWGQDLGDGGGLHIE